MKTALILLILAALALPTAVRADGISVLTEELPPYNYQDQGQASGISTDILLRMAERAGVPIRRRDIRVWPWARAYKEIRSRDNVILYSMVRTKDRETTFQWIGPIMPLKCLLIARRESGIHITDFDRDIERLRIGTVRDNAAEEYLIAHGADPDRLQRVHDLRLNLRKLLDGRIDALTGLEGALRIAIKEAGRRFDDFEVVYTLMCSDLYYAASRDMDPAVIARLQKALDELRAEGVVDAVVASHLH